MTNQEILAALDQHKTKTAAARALGIPRTTLNGRIDAINRGVDIGKMTEMAPEGFYVKGVSAYVDSDGNVKSGWVKTDKLKEDQLAKLIETLEERFSKVRAIKRIKAPRQTQKDCLTVIPYGDPHVGMLAWHGETGENYDLKKNTTHLIEATQRAVDVSRPTEKCLIAQLGDFFHADDQKNRTPGHGHQLDVDSRYGKILEAGIDAMCTIIDTALAKHKTVYVINARGNHDPHTAIVLSVALKHHYRSNPRVQIWEPAAFFHYLKFGKCLIGVTHGDAIRRIEDLAGIMATDKASDWGDTEHRYWYTGHIHHRRVFEVPGCVLESFRTTAARDAYAQKGGYRSGRDLNSITLHKDHGEIERSRIDISMLD